MNWLEINISHEDWFISGKFWFPFLFHTLNAVTKQEWSVGMSHTKRALGEQSKKNRKKKRLFKVHLLEAKSNRWQLLGSFPSFQFHLGENLTSFTVQLEVSSSQEHNTAVVLGVFTKGFRLFSLWIKIFTNSVSLDLFVVNKKLHPEFTRWWDTRH